MTNESTPSRIHADRAAGVLAIDWADGHRTEFDAVSLRWLCPCAYCRGEAGLPGWLDARPTLTPEQTRLVDVRLVGQYALAPIWADGHATGYYPFALLRERCPCPACAAGRARSSASGRSAGDASAASDHAGHVEHAPTASATEGRPR